MTLVKTLGPGDQFGEYAIMSEDGKRSGTIFTITPIKLAALNGDAYKLTLYNEFKKQ